MPPFRTFKLRRDGFLSKKIPATVRQRPSLCNLPPAAVIESRCTGTKLTSTEEPFLHRMFCMTGSTATALLANPYWPIILVTLTDCMSKNWRAPEIPVRLPFDSLAPLSPFGLRVPSSSTQGSCEAEMCS